MPRYLLFLPFLFGGFAARAQQEFTVDDFSPLYYGRIHVAQPQEVFSPGWISIHDKKTGRELLKVESEELAVTLRKGQPQSNVQQLPYGEQSVIISRDFNFDGRQDLAIQDGQNSCYHGPSFQVFLATATGLRADSAFTRLAQEYCGMFYVNAQEKKLMVTTKSGCCWHERSEFVVRDNAPFLVQRIAEDMVAFPFATNTIETWNGQRLVTKTERYLVQEHQRLICSFQLAENGKRVVLLQSEGRLYYALLRKDETVEFGYPLPEQEEVQPFQLRKTGNGLSLHFRNGPAQYEIRETPAGKLMVTARTSTRTLNLTAAAPGKKGSLRPLLTAKLENLRVQP